MNVLFLVMSKLRLFPVGAGLTSTVICYLFFVESKLRPFFFFIFSQKTETPSWDLLYWILANSSKINSNQTKSNQLYLIFFFCFFFARSSNRITDVQISCCTPSCGFPLDRILGCWTTDSGCVLHCMQCCCCRVLFCKWFGLRSGWPRWLVGMAYQCSCNLQCSSRSVYGSMHCARGCANSMKSSCVKKVSQKVKKKKWKPSSSVFYLIYFNEKLLSKNEYFNRLALVNFTSFTSFWIMKCLFRIAMVKCAIFLAELTSPQKRRIGSSLGSARTFRIYFQQKRQVNQTFRMLVGLCSFKQSLWAGSTVVFASSRTPPGKLFKCISRKKKKRLNGAHCWCSLPCWRYRLPLSKEEEANSKARRLLFPTMTTSSIWSTLVTASWHLVWSLRAVELLVQEKEEEKEEEKERRRLN